MCVKLGRTKRWLLLFPEVGSAGLRYKRSNGEHRKYGTRTLNANVVICGADPWPHVKVPLSEMKDADPQIGPDAAF